MRLYKMNVKRYSRKQIGRSEGVASSVEKPEPAVRVHFEDLDKYGSYYQVEMTPAQARELGGNLIAAAKGFD